jgi:hypothetical protein
MLWSRAGEKVWSGVMRAEAMWRMVVELELRRKAGSDVRESKALAVAEMKTDLESLQLWASER